MVLQGSRGLGEGGGRLTLVNDGGEGDKCHFSPFGCFHCNLNVANKNLSF